MSDGKQSKPEDTKPGRIIDAEVEPVSPEEAAKPGAPDDPPRVDLRSGGEPAQPKPGAAKAGSGGAAAAGPAGQGSAAPAGAAPGGAAKGPAAASAGKPSGPAGTGRPANAGTATGGGAAGGGPGGAGGGGPGGRRPGATSGGTPRRPGALVWGLIAGLVVLVVLVAGLVASPVVAPWLPQALGVAGPGGDPAELEKLQGRFADLEDRVAAAGKASQAAQGQAGDLADLRRTIDDLQKRVQSMGGLAGQMDQVQQQVAGLSRTDPAALDDQLKQVQARLQEMQQKLAAANAPDPQLQERLKQVDESLASVTQLADSIQRRMSGMDNRLNDLRSRDDAVERRLTGLDDRLAAAAQPAPQVTSALDDLRSRAGEMQSRLDGLRDALAAERTARLAAEDRTAGRNQRVALVLALGQIEDRLEAGTSFAGEASTLPGLLTGSLAQDPLAQEAVTALRRQGAAPIASFDTLRQDFMASAGQALQQRAASAPEPGWWDQVVGTARGLVSIRPVGDIAGDTPGAILARAEQALDARDLSRAVDEVGNLSGGPAEAMAGWLAQARARLAVTGAVSQLYDAVTASLTAAGSAASARTPAPTAAPAASPNRPAAPATASPAAAPANAPGNPQANAPSPAPAEPPAAPPDEAAGTGRPPADGASQDGQTQ